MRGDAPAGAGRVGGVLRIEGGGSGGVGLGPAFGSCLAQASGDKPGGDPVGPAAPVEPATRPLARRLRCQLWERDVAVLLRVGEGRAPGVGHDDLSARCPRWSP